MCTSTMLVRHAEVLVSLQGSNMVKRDSPKMRHASGYIHPKSASVKLFHKSCLTSSTVSHISAALRLRDTSRPEALSHMEVCLSPRGDAVPASRGTPRKPHSGRLQGNTHSSAAQLKALKSCKKMLPLGTSTDCWRRQELSLTVASKSAHLCEYAAGRYQASSLKQQGPSSLAVEGRAL